MRLIPLCSALLVFLALCGWAGPAGAAEPADGSRVLVVYQSDDRDRDFDGLGDSEQTARYYAARRGVPQRQLLGLALLDDGKPRAQWTYGQFYEQILKPVAARLAEAGEDGRPIGRQVCYIVTVPPLPVSMDTKHPAPRESRNWFAKTTRRSVDSYLISIQENLAAGVDEQTGAPGKGLAGPLGASGSELALPLLSPTPILAKPFVELREGGGERYNFYLVNRLGLDAATAMNMIDGALYAEMYLRQPGPDEKVAIRPQIWLDQKYSFRAGDHVSSMSRLIPLAHGAPPSPLGQGAGILGRWPLVIDNQDAEIGLTVEGKAHRPMATAVIAPDGVDERGVRLLPNKNTRGDAASMLYFTPGGRVSNGTASALIVGGSAADNRLLLDSTRGFAAGDTISQVWPGEFPTDDCFIFYGFYGLGQYEDVFRWPPGAVGVHVDSSCMKWASQAMQRGIAATFGVTTEPLSAGIPYGHVFVSSLAAGRNWADSAYASLRLAQRWTGVVFGDPLYAPFRSQQRVDATAPVIGPVRTRTLGGKAHLWASLAGQSDEQRADVALFRLEYGPSDRYGQTIEFFDWPQPDKSKNVPARRFGYSRNFHAELAGLAKGKTVHYRLTARDPAGNTSSVAGSFVP